MKLIIGGTGQGKLDYALSRTGCTMNQVARTPEEAKQAKIWNHLERSLRVLDGAGEDCGAIVREVLCANPDIIILCDEVGCGVVPVAPEERRWRELTGRICCGLAKEAETVERVFCGIPMVLKG